MAPQLSSFSVSIGLCGDPGMSLGSSRSSDLGYGSPVGTLRPIVTVHHYGLIHVGCMWVINIHQGPVIAEAHSSQCVLGCRVS